MGVATLTHGSNVLRFRTNPNSIKWTYTLNTHVEETYGGRVVQILSTKIENLTVTADSGRGGWPYLYQVATFFRDLLNDQRDGAAAIFNYPGRNYVLKVYASAFPFKDAYDDVPKEFTMSFKVQEDVSGIVTSDTLQAELQVFQGGIGFERTEGINYFSGGGSNSTGTDLEPWQGTNPGSTTAPGATAPGATPGSPDTSSVLGAANGSGSNGATGTAVDPSGGSLLGALTGQ